MYILVRRVNFIPYSRLNTTYKLESSKVVDTVDMEDLGRTDELFLIIAMILIGIDAGLPEPVIFDFAGSGSGQISAPAPTPTPTPPTPPTPTPTPTHSHSHSHCHCHSRHCHSRHCHKSSSS